ncbi:MAG TPA: hypothetical protein VMV32_10060, partial [Ignavibacteriaceae bacterium]|nr:hypothetical protein [Ignavibacteriaceae bacterium]
KGLFFQFADHYYYANRKADFKSLNDDQIFNAFKKYLEEQKYTYKSPTEGQVNQLLAEIKTKNIDKSIYENLEKVKLQFEKLGDRDLSIYKREIIEELKIELATRYIGNNGAVREMLSDDVQFQTALKILSNKDLYDKILAIKN